MITLTIGRIYKEVHLNVKTAVQAFKDQRDMAANNGEKTDPYHKAKLTVGKETYRVSYNGKIWDKNDNLVIIED